MNLFFLYTIPTYPKLDDISLLHRSNAEKYQLKLSATISQLIPNHVWLVLEPCFVLVWFFRRIRLLSILKMSEDEATLAVAAVITFLNF